MIKSIVYSRFFYVYLFITVISFVIKFLTPPILLLNTPHDDLLFAKLGISLSNNEWLGMWNQNTLLKEPLFPLIAASIVPGERYLSAQLLIHGIYLCSSSLIFILNNNISNINKMIIYFFLALNPFLFNSSGNRHYREVLIASLVLLFLIFSSSILFKNNKFPFFFMIFVYFFYSLFLLTKFDIIIWTLPVLITVTAVFLAGHNKNSIKFSLSLFFKILFLALILATPTTLISLKNYQFYQVFLITDQYQGNLPKLYSTLQSIESNKPNRKYVQVDKHQRSIAYSVSPKFKMLEASLESSPNTGWKIQSCTQLQICDESAGWFINELRDALYVNSDGTAAGFQNLAEGIHKEILESCKKEEINCSRTFPLLNNLVNVGFGKEFLRFSFHSLSFGVFDSNFIENEEVDIDDIYTNTNWQFFSPYNYGYQIDFISQNITDQFNYYPINLHSKLYLLALILFLIKLLIDKKNIMKFDFQNSLYKVVIISPFFLQIAMISMLELINGGYKLNFMHYISESYVAILIFLQFLAQDKFKNK
jgi:hypothetical protein